MTAAESYVQVAPDSTGKKIRNIQNTVGANDVQQQVVTIAKADGTLPDDPALQCDYDGSGNLIYVGVATSGTATSAAAWGIRKLFYDGSGNFLRWLWANGVATRDQIWDSRAALTYS